MNGSRFFSLVFAFASLCGCSSSETPSTGGTGDSADTEVRQNRTPLKLDCTLTELHDDGVFEESLSKEEYPDIGIEVTNGNAKVDIGASVYDGTDNDKLVIKSRSGNDIDITILMNNKPHYRIAVVAKKGVIEDIENGGPSKVADFKCR